jgi:predicted phage tail protein
MAPDNILPADPDFHDWVVPFSAFVTTNAAAMGLVPDDVAPLTAAVTAWGTAYPAHKTAGAAASAATTHKDGTRAAVESVARPLIQQLQASPKVTDAQRKTMKINVRSTTRTRAGVPTTAPMATVDTSRRLQHVISYRDSVSSSKKKPAGVAYCEIWAKVGGPAPTDVSQLTYLGNASSSPQLEEFTGAQAGQLVYYWLRWVNTRGEKGPWSEPVIATIAG